MGKPGVMEPELLRNFGRKVATVFYPFEKRALPEGLKGKHSFDASECNWCELCSKVCPAFAIEMVTVGYREIKGKKKPKRQPSIHLDRCIFCQQCEESCPTKALHLTTEYELSGYTHEEFHLEFEFEEEEK